jgi:hypothetical protein
MRRTKAVVIILVAAGVIFMAASAAGLLYIAHRCDRALNRLEDAERRAADFAAWTEELKQ